MRCCELRTFRVWCWCGRPRGRSHTQGRLGGGPRFRIAVRWRQRCGSEEAANLNVSSLWFPRRFAFFQCFAHGLAVLRLFLGVQVEKALQSRGVLPPLQRKSFGDRSCIKEENSGVGLATPEPSLQHPDPAVKANRPDAGNGRRGGRGCQGLGGREGEEPVGGGETAVGKGDVGPEGNSGVDDRADGIAEELGRRRTCGNAEP